MKERATMRYRAAIRALSRTSAVCICFMLGLIHALSATAADVLPGAFTALPVGMSAVQVFQTHIERDKQYVDGHARPIDARLDSDVSMLRYHRLIEVGGYTVDPNIIVPYVELEGKRDLSAFGKESGLGDVVLNAIVWLVNDPKSRTFFGISPYLYVPTGHYDNDQRLNAGENRWKFALQAGYTTALSDRVLFDLTGDVTLFGKNDDLGRASADLEQDEAYQVQSYLRYKLTPAFEANAGLSHVWGGETKVGGARQGNELRTTKYMIGASYMFGPATQLLAQYGRDISVENGFRESGKFLLRFTQMF
ncbi:transporter [Aromatoleum toluclasticum]|uniref:transporter n=1 Tax=Aromatoleum toluclasticum TaxID=92003 RepID=UPI0018DEED6E|nr:transporter [Aromatoleum toluclasticum]